MKCANYLTMSLISHAIKTMLQILQPILYPNIQREMPDVQMGLEEAKEQEILLFIRAK